MPVVVLHDGTTLECTVTGKGPALLLSVGLSDPDPELAAEACSHGLDPYLGRNLINALSRHMRVVAFDYEAHVLAHPKLGTLTLDNIAADVLRIAGAVNAPSFSFYGQSWMALVGPHLASLTPQLKGFAMGGFPVVDMPLAELVDIAVRHHRAVVTAPVGSFPNSSWAPRGGAISFSAQLLHRGEGPETATSRVMDAARARQFVTFFKDAQTQTSLSRRTIMGLTIPRLCFVGSEDVLRNTQGTLLLSLAAPVIRHRPELEERGWRIEVLEGLDALDAMQPELIVDLLVSWHMERASPSGT